MAWRNGARPAGRAAMPRHGVKVDSSLLECPFCVRKEKKMDAQGTDHGAEAGDAEGDAGGGGAPGAQRQKRRMKKKRQENKIGLW